MGEKELKNRRAIGEPEWPLGHKHRERRDKIEFAENGFEMAVCFAQIVYVVASS